MREKLDNLLKAINLANYDSLKAVTVSLSDLMFLRETVKSQQETIKQMQREIYVLQAKVELKSIEQAINLDSFKMDKYA